jgi:hypothetical protein
MHQSAMIRKCRVDFQVADRTSAGVNDGKLFHGCVKGSANVCANAFFQREELRGGCRGLHTPAPPMIKLRRLCKCILLFRTGCMG